MSLFKKAEKKADRLKLYVYGGSGAGKTTLALQFPNPAVIDAEGGTKHYGKYFDFERIDSNNPDVISEAVDELLENPRDIKTLVIDPMTVIYDKLVQMKVEQMKLKTGNIHYEIQPLDYKPIKSEVKIIMNKLLSLDMNIVVTARSKPLYEKGAGKFMQQIGNQPEGPTVLPYMFDTVIELYVDDSGQRWAKVEKDRTNTLPERFEFSYEEMCKYLDIEALSRPADADLQKKNLEERNFRTTEITVNGEKVMTAGVSSETLTKLLEETKEINKDALADLLIDEYECSSLFDLSEASGLSLLTFIVESKKQN